jgi:lipid-binding SYLF domain-containing protein
MFSLARSALALSLLLIPRIGSAPTAPASETEHQRVLNTIAKFKKTDPTIDKFFSKSAGYAVLPSIGKGAVGVGGAYGTGELLVDGKSVGNVKMTQVSVGLALGGQRYSEIVFFETKEQLEDFQKGEFSLTAQASAVAVKDGAASQTNYDNGIATFTMPIEGLMGEASIGGQKFTYKAF